jgi:hypothetical protein
MTLILNSQPEWVECGKTWSEFSARDYDPKTKTWNPSNGVCAAGVLIEVMEENGTRERYTIGDVNEHGGFCDDCSIRHDALVLRYLDLREATTKLTTFADVIRETK